MRKYLAELIGTYTLIFCGTGAIMINEIAGGVIGHAGIATTFGLIVIALVYSIGDISGAHINPAVTIAFSVAGTFPRKEIAPYILAQCLGAILASGTLRLLFPDSSTMGDTLPANSLMQSFILEVILSFFLMFIIINVATGSKEVGIMAGLAIGITVLLEALFAGPISGASMNPARSLGPAVFSLKLNTLWIYLIAPPIGMVLSIWVWRIIKLPHPN